MFAEMSFALGALLIVIAFFAGIGCTTLGPGGIFTTLALYTLTAVPSSTVAGTAHFTFIGVGLLGSLSYLQSGELRIKGNARIAVVLSLSSIVGALAGAAVNTYVSRELFGLLLGGFAAGTGLLIIYRERSERLPQFDVDYTSVRGTAFVSFIGLVLGCLSGLLGVGGPVIAVPILIVLGIPMLSALAVAQVQSIFIATFATAGYAINGAVSIPLALLVGIPQLVGAFLGWRIAHYVDPDRLKVALGVTMIAVGPYLAFQ
ncbi:sulfite exporter TauE/SafE family protein [Halobellus sp. Atlit-38R]|uniref:sulfite exporter TauE/SafE family protein n=1 Tax=Halobellus sp. Atlit-38R TaxID=2282131 RepID=UPI0018F78AB5|nr:sulfite exporter TauE/SafE family protein [Halobellus sp. Atlit-38R]